MKSLMDKLVMAALLMSLAAGCNTFDGYWDTIDDANQPALAKVYPWSNRNVDIIGPGSESTVYWQETDELIRVTGAGENVVTWEYKDNKPHSWPAEGMGWAQGNIMWIGRFGGLWVECWGEWLRAKQQVQDGRIPFDRFDGYTLSDADEAWMCIAGLNRNGLRSVRERTSWFKIK